MTNFTMHTVRRISDDTGTTIQVESTDLPNRAPHRTGHRATVGYRIGLDYVKSIQGQDTDVIAVTISTTRANRGRMALASWRVMPTLTTQGHAAFTGTSDVHPLVSQAMRGETFGQYLNRRITEVV